MENRRTVRGNDIRLYTEFFHKIINPLSQESAVFTVEGYEIVSAHILHFPAQFGFQMGRIIVSSGAVNMKTPLAVFISKCGTAYIQAVYRRSRHEADAGHRAIVFHFVQFFTNLEKFFNIFLLVEN